MQIQYVDIEKIIPYAQNSRKHSDAQIDHIAKSIQEFGFNQPIVADEALTVLVGHARLAAAQKLGLKEVPTIQLYKLSTKQKRTYRILDNKLQNDSSWDFNNLETELAGLQELGFNLDDYGLKNLYSLFGDEIAQGEHLGEWQGMPEYSSEDETAYRTLIVHFESEADVKTFSKLVQQSLSEKTRSIWFPKRERTKNEDKIVDDES